MSGKAPHSIQTRRRHTWMSWSVQNRNAPLSTLEIDSIHASVRGASNELKKVERDLESAKKTVQELNKRRKELYAFIKHERAMLSPIRTLPQEVLGEVFTHHVALFPHHRPCIIAALTLSQICRNWRTTAHATPVLWTRFPLYYLEAKYFPKHEMILYDSWVQRAGSLLCDVALRQGSAAMKARDDATDSFMDRVLINYSGGWYDKRNSVSKARWKTLDLWYLFDTNFSVKNIGSVRSLTVHIPEPARGTRRLELVEAAPKLEELILSCGQDYLDEPVVLPRLPLQTVKRAELVNFCLTNGLQIMAEANELETLKWTTVWACEGPANIFPQVTTSLRVLELNILDSSEDALSPLFDNLTASHLEMLYIRWMYRQDASAYWDSLGFLAFLSRSAASLTSLTFLHADICEADLITLLEQTPLLVHLSLSDRYERRGWDFEGRIQMLGARILRRLLPPAPGELFPEPGLLPNLEVLRLRGGFEGNDMCDADIFRVFEARYPPENKDSMLGGYPRLREGAFHLLRPADEAVPGQVSLEERASRLRWRGLDFEFTTMEPDPDDDREEDESGKSSSGSEDDG